MTITDATDPADKRQYLQDCGHYWRDLVFLMLRDPAVDLTEDGHALAMTAAAFGRWYPVSVAYQEQYHAHRRTLDAIARALAELTGKAADDGRAPMMFF